MPRQFAKAALAQDQSVPPHRATQGAKGRDGRNGTSRFFFMRGTQERSIINMAARHLSQSKTPQSENVLPENRRPVGQDSRRTRPFRLKVLLYKKSALRRHRPWPLALCLDPNNLPPLSIPAPMSCVSAWAAIGLNCGSSARPPWQRQTMIVWPLTPINPGARSCWGGARVSA